MTLVMGVCLFLGGEWLRVMNNFVGPCSSIAEITVKITLTM